MLLFVSFLPMMCPQLLKGRRLACSWLPIPRFRLCGHADATAVWFSALVKSKYIAPRNLLLLTRAATEGPNSNPVICSGLGRRRSVGTMSFWMTLGRIVCTCQFLHLWAIVGSAKGNAPARVLCVHALSIQRLESRHLVRKSSTEEIRVCGTNPTGRLITSGLPPSGRGRHRSSKSGLSMFGLLDYRGCSRRRLHSPRAERMKVRPPSPPSAQSVKTKKKPPGDLAISP